MCEILTRLSAELVPGGHVRRPTPVHTDLDRYFGHAFSVQETRIHFVVVASGPAGGGLRLPADLYRKLDTSFAVRRPTLRMDIGGGLRPGVKFTPLRESLSRAETIGGTLARPTDLHLNARHAK
ncbi:hypothetical protein Bbelb_208670 [Branchiostoma belcheri]|nr:hypothetical protein Bbelb_208670 [Branchiostoma belcheri]